jgi:hypothetical protein
MSKEDMLEALQEIADCLDQRSDADFNDHFYVPNEAMRLQQKVKADRSDNRSYGALTRATKGGQTAT